MAFARSRPGGLTSVVFAFIREAGIQLFLQLLHGGQAGVEGLG
jgi:hypothetical protein